MGTFYWPMEIGPLDGSRYETVNAMVDTGATFSQVPDSLLRGLGIVPTRNVQSQLADGSIIQDGVADVKIRISGRETYSTVFVRRGRIPDSDGFLCSGRSCAGSRPAQWVPG